MKTYKNINFYYLGQYVCSTFYYKSCKEARKAFLEHLKSLAKDRLILIEILILDNPEGLKVSYK